jgi:FlaG/FlaF family flagellin (archaellin)
MKIRKKIRKKVRAISPVLAILLMIVITVAASLVTYAWVMGYLSFTTAKAGRAMQVQSVHYTNATDKTLTVWVQNVGEEFVTLRNDSSVYVDGILQTEAEISNTDDGALQTGETAQIVVSNVIKLPGERVRVRVVDESGTFTEIHTYPLTGGATSGTMPFNLVVLADDFERPNSPTVGGGWVEIESNPAEEVQILSNRVDFDSVDGGTNEPRVYQTFTPQTTGKLRWAFTFSFSRTGGENTYEAFMQLGEGLTGDPAGDTASVAVNLKWGGTNNGFSDHEGFGYQDGGTTQVAVVSGPGGSNSGGDATIDVIADLDAKTFDLTITGAGFISGTGSAIGIPFDNSVNIDTVRIYLEGVNQGNFGVLEIDDVLIETVP